MLAGMWGKRNPHTLLVGRQASTITLENNMEASLKNKHISAIQSSNPTPNNISKECDSGYSKGTCTPMFIVALFTIVKLGKQARCSTTDKWIKKMWYLYTMEFYSATKKNDIFSFTSKWMELENIILSKVSQSEKAKSHMFSLICGI
jgi:hypothetical protein